MFNLLNKLLNALSFSIKFVVVCLLLESNLAISDSLYKCDGNKLQRSIINSSCKPFLVDIAKCETQLKGYAYYPFELGGKFNGVKIQDDKLGNFSVEVIQTENGYLFEYVDVNKSRKSVASQGGRVNLIRKGVRDISFLVEYPGEVVEIYTFTKSNKSGTVTLLTNRSGDLVLDPKNSLLVGQCNDINIP